MRRLNNFRLLFLTLFVLCAGLSMLRAAAADTEANGKKAILVTGLADIPYVTVPISAPLTLFNRYAMSRPFRETTARSVPGKRYGGKSPRVGTVT